MTSWGGTSDAVAFVGDWSGQVVATSVHAGHELRPDIAAAMVLDETERFREEAPHTDRIAAVVPDRVVTTRSRFEADLNRPRREAVYRRNRMTASFMHAYFPSNPDAAVALFES